LFAALKPASRLSEWGLEMSVEKKMREKHEFFVAEAFHNIRMSGK
jgi:hypothetical protein